MAIAATVRHKLVNKSLQALRSITEKWNKYPTNITSGELDIAKGAIHKGELILDAMESMAEVRVAYGAENESGLGELFIAKLDAINDYPYIIDANRLPRLRKKKARACSAA
jgi:hypothetical protein